MTTHNPVTVFGLDTNGDPSTVRATGNGIVSKPTDYILDVLNGEHSSDSFTSKFFFRDNTTAAGGFEVLWSVNAGFTVMTTADTFTITYNNTTDGLGTTGALQLFVTYLDANLDEQIASHTLGNTGSDVTSFSGVGINRAVVFSAGSANINTNDITLVDTTNTNTQAHIPAGFGVTQQSVLHLPRLCTPVLRYVRLSASRQSGANPKVAYRLNVYSRVTGVNYIVRRYSVDTAVETTVQEREDVPLSGQDVVWFTSDTDRDNTEIDGTYTVVRRSTA